jgi:CubicO group peptidase (beta-lactamase class C family)
MTARSTSVALALLLSLVGCDTDTDVADDTFRGGGHGHGHGHGKKDIYPDAEWQEGNPEQHGLSAEGLEAMAAVAAEWDTSCMMVIHDGVLVGEWYWDGFDRHTNVANVFSVTKSITSTLVGVAHEEGELHINQKAKSYIPEWDGTPSENVRIRNLISNDSGRFWSFESDYGGLMYGADQTGYAVSLPQQYWPGAVWEYNNSAIQTLERILEAATGQDVASYAEEKLFAKIGASATMTSDPSGNPLTYQGVTASCDDMARFGYLALREGRWKNKQVVSKQWLKKATKPSTQLNDAYGYMWWLNRDGHVVEPSFPERVEYDGQLIPGSSEEVFTAVGAFGQLVIVDPEDEYVIVRLQHVPDINEALGTCPDPIGISQLQEIMSAFEQAKI